MKNLIYGAYGGGWAEKPIAIIDLVKELGFDMLEISVGENTPEKPREIRRRLQDAGLEVVASTGCPRDGDLTDEDPGTRSRGIEFLKECVRTTAELGATHLVGLLYSTVGRRTETLPDDRYWEWAASALKEVAVYARDFGVVLGFETVNHYETILNNTVNQALRFRDMIGETNVMLHLDTFHLNMEEDSLYQATKKALPYLCHYHFAEGNRGQIGKGTVDWDGVYRALAEGDYHGTVTLESFAESPEQFKVLFGLWRERGRSTSESLKEGLDFLKEIEKKHYK
jgi:D-psicose/D-tagatose/L-ribulose 3-epimerase